MRASNIRNSLLSILCIVSWIVITFRIFASDDTGVTYVFVYYLLMIGLGSLGGILLIFLNIMKGGKFKSLFIFNLFATWNLLLGILGLASFYSPGHTPYIAAGSIAIGIVMYRIIYFENLSKAWK